MKSKTTQRFRGLLANLPSDVRRQAFRAYSQFKSDPYHPSLHFKRVSNSKPLYSVRIGQDYRALGIREEGDLIVWVWIGSHADYDKLLSS